MKLMVEDMKYLQKDKIGKSNSIEELSFKINQLNLDKEQKKNTTSSKDQYKIQVSMKVSPLNTMFVMILKRYVYQV